MLSNSTSVIPPGNCGIHGYHGRTACPNCSTSALPFTPLIQPPIVNGPPVSAAVSPADTPEWAVWVEEAVNHDAGMWENEEIHWRKYL